jgi:hypothetical protein
MYRNYTDLKAKGLMSVVKDVSGSIVVTVTEPQKTIVTPQTVTPTAYPTAKDVLIGLDAAIADHTAAIAKHQALKADAQAMKAVP